MITPAPPRRKLSHFPFLMAAVAAGLILAGLGLALYAYQMASSRAPSGQGMALVGGPFNMLNQDGQPVTEQAFRGKPMLLFFGYTFCPDICPTELQVMAAALEQLGSAGTDIQPVFVTIDPARDTPELVKAYVANFGSRFQGLTGTPEQVSQMAKAYKVYYARQENLKSPPDYLMDHSSIVYLMAADGSFLKHFTYTTDAAALAEGIRKALGR